MLKTEFASRCTRQRMGSGLSKVQKVGTPNRLASFTSGAPSTCFDNTASSHGELPVRSDAATWVQTRRELDRVVELEQARQQFMQQVLSRCLLLTILNINLFLYSDCNAARSGAEAAGTFA